MFLISVVCPIYNEIHHIREFLQSLEQQDIGFSSFEVILVDGLSTDGTRDFIINYSKSHSNVFVMDNPERSVSYALNRAINRASGNYIARVDAHAIYPENYLSSLLEASNSSGADNVGCLIETVPANSSSKAKAISYVLSSVFGMGDSAFRVGAMEPKFVDTVPFGFFKKKVFERCGFFDVDLIRNQDDEMNLRIRRNGGTIFLLPSMKIKYFARASFGKVWAMFFQYGLFKPLVNKKNKTIGSLRQLVPPSFIVFLILLVLVRGNAGLFSIALGALLFMYLILVVSFSWGAARKFSDIKIFGWAFLCFPLVHIAYGIGYWKGFFNLLCGRRFFVNSSR